MVGIAFNLGGPAQVAGGKQAGAYAAHLHRGREIEWNAGNELLRLANIGDDDLFRLLGASRNAGKCQRCGSELQKIAAVGWIQPIGRSVGEFIVDESLKLFGLRQLFEALPVQRSLG